MIELMEHNKKTYSNLIENLKSNEKVALIQATGCGKSYIIAKLIEEFYESKNVLVIIPTLTIMENWRGIVREIKSNIEYVTYMDFGKDKEHEFEKYDLIIADEMHHLGSEVWGTKFKLLFMENKHNAKIIGLTATPIRYLDNCREMDIELFNGNTVMGITLSDAISQGVLPRFEYVLSMYRNENEYSEYKEKCSLIQKEQARSKLLRRLELVKENQISIIDILHKHMPTNKRKIIAFINEISETQEMINTLREAFPNANFYFVNSKMKHSNNIDTVNEFKNDASNISIMIAVDMFNEGVHISGVNTIIMYRKTISPAIYFQQLGRGLSSSNQDDVIIFDFASNCNNVKRIQKSNEQSSFIQGYNRTCENKDKQIIVNDYTVDCVSIFNEISENINEKKWEGADDTFLIQNINVISIREIANRLKKPVYAVRKRCEILGLNIQRETKHKWTREDDEYIIRNYSKENTKEIAKKIGVKYKESVNNRASFLGVKKESRKWTKEEDDYLKYHVCVNDYSPSWNYEAIKTPISPIKHRDIGSIRTRVYILRKKGEINY